MPQTIFLTLEQILFLHEDQIDLYGGSSGLRDLALLESAIYRPQATFGGTYLYESIFDKAACLMHSLIMNHPFIDGNKRTGMDAGIVFLELNGYTLKVMQKDVVIVALQIATKKMNIKELSVWLKNHTKRNK